MITIVTHAFFQIFYFKMRERLRKKNGPSAIYKADFYKRFRNAAFYSVY